MRRGSDRATASNSILGVGSSDCAVGFSPLYAAVADHGKPKLRRLTSACLENGVLFAQPLSFCREQKCANSCEKKFLESKSPVDIEESLGMYHGNIFHDAPSFPYAEKKKQAGSWGVETEFDNVFLCGSSAQRGGAVSGIPGHNAAMKVLETATRA